MFEPKKLCGIYTNLVFAGGGTKGIAYMGVLKYLQEHGLIEYCQRVIGSSAGALTAMLVASKVSYEAAHQELLNFPLSEIKDDDIGIIRDTQRLINRYGYYKGDRLEEEVGNLLGKYLGQSNIKFAEFYEKTGIDLIVTITCVEKGETWYCNYLTEPQMEVKKAVRMSMSIPWAFASIEYKGLHFCDGGVYDNFPIDYWDDKEKGIKNEHTLGFLLLDNNQYNGQKEDYDTSNLIQYSIALIRGAIDRSSLFHYEMELKSENCRIVKINIGKAKTLDTSLSEEQIKQLIESGYNSCIEYFKHKN